MKRKWVRRLLIALALWNLISVIVFLAWINGLFINASLLSDWTHQRGTFARISGGVISIDTAESILFREVEPSDFGLERFCFSARLGTIGKFDLVARDWEGTRLLFRVSASDLYDSGVYLETPAGQRRIARIDAEFTSGPWYRFELYPAGEGLALAVDGHPAARATQLPNTRGRLGFGAMRGGVELADVSVQGLWKQSTGTTRKVADFGQDRKAAAVRGLLFLALSNLAIAAVLGLVLLHRLFRKTRERDLDRILSLEAKDRDEPAPMARLSVSAALVLVTALLTGILAVREGLTGGPLWTLLVPVAWLTYSLALSGIVRIPFRPVLTDDGASWIPVLILGAWCLIRSPEGRQITCFSIHLWKAVLAVALLKLYFLYGYARHARLFNTAALLVCACSLLTIEPLLRLVPASYFQSYTFEFHRVDYRLFWFPAPGSIHAHLRTNSAGLVGPEVEQAKPPGVRRILTLGGSSTFGQGVIRPELTYPARLQEILDREARDRYQVINGGVYGYSSFQVKRVLAEKLSAYGPDLVTVNLASNDSEPSPVPPYTIEELWDVVDRVRSREGPIARLRGMRFYVYLADRLTRIRRYAAKALSGRYSVPTVTPEQFVANLEGIVDLGKEKGFGVVFIKEPVLEEHLVLASGEATDNPYYRAMDELGRRLGLAVLDGNRALLDQKGLEYFVDYVHLNADGYRVLAESLAPLVLSQFDDPPAGIPAY